MVMRRIPAAELRPGMVTFVDNGRGQLKPDVTVRSVVPGDSCKGMHVNSRLCYDRTALVYVKEVAS